MAAKAAEASLEFSVKSWRSAAKQQPWRRHLLIGFLHSLEADARDLIPAWTNTNFLKRP